MDASTMSPWIALILDFGFFSHWAAPHNGRLIPHGTRKGQNRQVQDTHTVLLRMSGRRPVASMGMICGCQIQWLELS